MGLRKLASKNRFFTLTLVTIMNFANVMDVMIMMPLSALFIKEFGITSSQFGYLLASYSISAFFSSITSAFLLDRFDRRRAILFIGGGLGIGTLLCGLVDTFELLLIVRFITGIFGGIIGALCLSIISDLYAFKERGEAIGILMSGFAIASAIGVPVGFYFASQFFWALPFFGIAAITLFAWALCYVYFPSDINKGVELHDPKSLIRILRKDSNMQMALLVGGIIVFAHFIIIPFITPQLIFNVGIKEIDISYVYLVGGILTVISAPLIGYMTDRFGVYKMFNVLMIISFIPVFMLTHMGSNSLMYALAITSMFFVFGSGRVIPPQSLITSAASPDMRGAFMSFKSAVQQLAMGLSVLVGSWIVSMDSDGRQLNYETVGYVSIAVSLLAMYMLPKIKVAHGN